MATYSHYDKISINSCKEKCVLGCSGYKNMNLIYPSKLVNIKPVWKSKDLFKYVPVCIIPILLLIIFSAVFCRLSGKILITGFLTQSALF